MFSICFSGVPQVPQIIIIYLRKKKERKYVIEKISTALSAFSAVFFFFVFRNPPVSDHYIQSLVVISILGLAVSLVIFFVLNVLEKYYFKSVFQWLFFSLSVVSFCISVILWIYFKSGMFWLFPVRQSAEKENSDIS